MAHLRLQHCTWSTCCRLTAPYLFVLGVVEVTMKWFYYNSVFEPPTDDHINCPNYWWRNAMYINTLFPVQDMVSYIFIWHETVHIHHACFCIEFNTSSQYTRGHNRLCIYFVVVMSPTYLVRNTIVLSPQLCSSRLQKEVCC